MKAVAIVEIQPPPVIACCPYASACPTSPSYSAISDAAVAAMADASGIPRCCASRSHVRAPSAASLLMPPNSSTVTASGSAVEVSDISRGVARTASRAWRIARSRSRPAAPSSIARLACNCGSRSSPASARACSRCSIGRMAGRVPRSQRATLSTADCSEMAIGDRSSPDSLMAACSTSTASAKRPHSPRAWLSASAISPRQGQSALRASASVRCSAAAAGAWKVWALPSSNSTSPRAPAAGGSASARSRHWMATSGAPRLRASAAAWRSLSTTQASPVAAAASRCTVTSAEAASSSSSMRAARLCQRCRTGGARSW